MLSLAGMRMLEKEVPGVPSTLILNGDVKLPASFMVDITMGWLLVFRTRNALTVEPVVVNTVSKRTESPEKDSLADELVITVSFLQENNRQESKKKTKK